MKKWMSILAVTMLLAATAGAANQPCDRELSIFGDYTHTPTIAGIDDAGGAGMAVSQYINNNTTIGLQGWMNWGNKSDVIVLGGNAKYHFMPTDPISPYLGGQLNYVYATNTAFVKAHDGFLWGPIVGVAFSVADKTSLFVEYQWQLYQGNVRHQANEGSSFVVGTSWGF